MSNLVWRLLRKNISAGQIAGYAMANLVGLVVVMVGLQFYRDVTAKGADDDPFISRDYVVMSKKVSGLGSLLGGSATIGASDLRALASRPWAGAVGEFTSADFDVTASVDLNGRGMSTALFFESIPDEFFDIRPQGWSYTPGSREIPIVLSKDYLALYNFGFAASRGLPQLTEGMIGMVPLRVSLSGNGRQDYFTGRVVGFSSRLNTIAVPQSFMDWANQRYGSGTREAPSRVIVEVTDPGNPDIERFAASYGLEIAGDKADTGRLAYFLSVLTAVVVGVGLLICVLAVFVLMLSIYLLLQRNREKLRTLMDLGYTPSELARRYEWLVVGVNALVLLAAAAAAATAAALWQHKLADLGAPTAPVWPTLLIGAAIVCLITLLNLCSVRRHVRRYWR